MIVIFLVALLIPVPVQSVVSKIIPAFGRFELYIGVELFGVIRPDRISGCHSLNQHFFTFFECLLLLGSKFSAFQVLGNG